MQAHHRPTLLGVLKYIASSLLWAVAWAGRFALDGILPEQGFPFLTFFPAVMLAAYLFGLGPGLLCAALSVAAAYISFIPRDTQSSIGLARGDLIAMTFFSSILVIDCVILHLLRRSRQLAAQREQDLRELTNNSPDVLTRFDRQFRHLFVSGAIERLTGKHVAEFIGKTNRELGMPGALCDQWEDALASVFRDAQPVSLRFEFDGTILAAKLVPEFDRTGLVRSVLGVTRDITEIDRHERALHAHDVRKDQMLATVAHELRNPLNTFSTGIALLERLPDPSPAVIRTIGAMRRQSTQMARLVNDLMDLNRIRADLFDLSSSSVDLRSVISSAQEASQHLCERKSVSVELDLPLEQDALVEGDAGRLVQVFTNLLTNAIKFSDDGGRVIVKAQWSSDMHQVCVVDHGVGLEPDMLEAVFEPFVQSPAGRSQQSGLGIGLALVKQIVRLHGGDVRATSEGPGKGAVFIVRLPALRRRDGVAPSREES